LALFDDLLEMNLRGHSVKGSRWDSVGKSADAWSRVNGRRRSSKQAR
jgi:hypothetical protein